MEGIQIRRVSRNEDSAQHYYRLYTILKGVLPKYVGRIEMLEHSRRLGIKSHAVLFEDTPVGGYVLHDEGDVAYLEFIGLTEGMQGKGLGKLMVNHMAEKARELGRDRIRAETESCNLPKFKKLGFKEYSPGDKGMVGIYLNVF
jgi:GNAT superfamily N-acetyltransferase